MKIHSVFYNSKGERLELKRKEKPNAKEITVVYAHAGEVNYNGLLLRKDSLIIERDRYPVYLEHNDSRIENVIGYIKPDKEVNDNNEFVGKITFCDTEQGKFAAKLWEDGVFNQLSVAYYVTNSELKFNEAKCEDYIEIIEAQLKEVSIVSVGSDPKTGEVEHREMNHEDAEVEETEIDEEIEDNLKKVENSPSDDVNSLKLKLLKMMVV